MDMNNLLDFEGLVALKWDGLFQFHLTFYV